MRLIYSLVRTARRRDLGQYIKYFLLYALCALFLTAELLIGYSYIITFDGQLADTYGEQDMIVLADTELEARLREDERVARYGTMTQYAMLGQLGIGTISDEAIELQHIKMLWGRFPMEQGEIALERTWWSTFYNGTEIGDVIELEGISFTLCGVLDDYSGLQWQSEGSTTLPCAMVSEATALTLPEADAAVFYSIALADGVDADSYFNELMSLEPVLFGCRNQATTSQLAEQYLGNRSKILPLVLLLGVLLMVAVLIYVTSISNRQNVGKMAQFKIVGMGDRALRQYFLLQTLERALPAAVVGCAGGVAATFGVLRVFMGFEFGFSGVLILVALLLSAVLPPMLGALGLHKYYSASVLELLRPSDGAAEEVRDVGGVKTKDPVMLCAVRNYKSSGSRGVTFRVLMLVATVLIVITSFWTIRSINDAASAFSAGDIFVYWSGRMYIDSGGGYIAADPFSAGIKDDAYEKIRESDEVSRVVGFKYLNMFVAEDIADVTPQDRWSRSDDYVSTYGFPSDVTISPARLQSVSNEIIKLLAPYIVGVEGYEELLRDGRHVLYLSSIDPLFRTAGDEVRFMQYIPGEEPYMLDISTEVVGYIDLNDLPDELSDLQYALIGGYLWSEDSFAAHELEPGCMEIFVTFKDVDRTDATEKLISNINYLYGDRIGVHNYLQSKRAALEQRKITATAGFSVSGVMLVFSLISLAITLELKISRRRRTLGVLRAIGMTERQQYRALLYETWFDVLFVGIVSAVTAVAMGLLYAAKEIIIFRLSTRDPMVQSILDTFTFADFPGWLLPVPVVLYLAVSAIACLLPIRKFYRESNVECMRDALSE